MAYGRKYARKTATPRSTPRTSRGKYTPRKKYSKKMPMASFAKRVNQIISRNNENKVTQSLSYVAPVSSISNAYTVSGNTNTYSAFVWTPSDTIFNISQGANVQQRIGNKIKLKRWIIKGFVEPNKDFSLTRPNISGTVYTTTGIAINSQLGYVDIYFGREKLNIDPVSPQLTDFYQNGSTAVTPTYTSQEKLYKMNDNYYKVYWHKRFRLGSTSAVPTETAIKTDPTFAQANGFSTTRSFGFDVTKYILKNKVLCYDESAIEPQNAECKNLTLWAIFHPAAGDMTATSATVDPLFSPTVNNCYYNMNVLSYAEYEDS